MGVSRFPHARSLRLASLSLPPYHDCRIAVLESQRISGGRRRRCRLPQLVPGDRYFQWICHLTFSAFYNTIDASIGIVVSPPLGSTITPYYEIIYSKFDKNRTG